MIEVSVITAAYNSADVIERNVRSVAAQTMRAREHIIVDDGSVDGTAAVVRQLQAEFASLKLIRQGNLGAAAARNRGIEHASSRYVAFLDSDDAWSAEKLESQIRFMADNQVPFSYGDYHDVDSKTGRLLGSHQAPEQLTYSDLLRGCPIGCLTVAFDQHLLGKRFMPDVRRGQDWGFWLALTRDGAVGQRYPGCHAYYHRAENSLSSSKVGKAADIFRIYRDQERLGTLQSLYYFLPHVFSAMTKRPVSQSRL